MDVQFPYDGATQTPQEASYYPPSGSEGNGGSRRQRGVLNNQNEGRYVPSGFCKDVKNLNRVTVDCDGSHLKFSLTTSLLLYSILMNSERLHSHNASNRTNSASNTIDEFFLLQ